MPSLTIQDSLALHISEVLFLILANLEDRQLNACRTVSRLWRDCVDHVRASRKRETIECTLPGDTMPTVFYGSDILDGTSGRVMKYRPLPKTPVIVRLGRRPYQRKPPRLELTVDGTPFQIIHVLDRYLICDNLALEADRPFPLDGSHIHIERTVKAVAVYRTLSRDMSIHPTVQRLWNSPYWRSHPQVTGAMRLYMNTTNIDVLVGVMMDLLQDSLQICGESIQMERNRLEILALMKREKPALAILQTIHNKLDRRFLETIAGLNIFVRDLAYTPKEELRNALKRALLKEVEPLYSPGRARNAQVI